MRLPSLLAEACAAACLSVTANLLCAEPAPSAPLNLIGATDLPNYTGDLDHLAVDLFGGRLFVAGEDGSTIEVFDLKTGVHRASVNHVVQTPHYIFLIPSKNRVLVTDAGDGMTKILNASTFKPERILSLHPGADSAFYDPSLERLYIVTGGRSGKLFHCYLEAVDPKTLESYGAVELDSDRTEALAVEERGDRIFVNLTDKNVVAVIDKRTLKQIATWPIKAARENAPIALDEARHRLFVVTRAPARVVVLDTQTGRPLAIVKAPNRANGVFFDQARRRLYVTGGDGYIGVYQEGEKTPLEVLASVPTGLGAKTGLFVPSLDELFVMQSPGAGRYGARLLRYSVAPPAPGAGAGQ